MRRLIWKFFRGQIRSSKKKPRPRVLGRGLGSFWRNLFRSSAYYLRGFALLFKQKICCLKAKQMLQKYHSGREKAWLPPRMGVVGVRFSSNSRQEAALLRVVVFTIFKQSYGGTTMKKLLMCTAAVALGLAVAAPAKADGIKLDLAGHFKGYVTWISQDTPPDTNERHFDILRQTEIHFTGEVDFGLTQDVEMAFIGIRGRILTDPGDVALEVARQVQLDAVGFRRGGNSKAQSDGRRAHKKFFHCSSSIRLLEDSEHDNPETGLSPLDYYLKTDPGQTHSW